jgi:hypothetical protein
MIELRLFYEEMDKAMAEAKVRAEQHEADLRRGANEFSRRLDQAGRRESNFAPVDDGKDDRGKKEKGEKAAGGDKLSLPPLVFPESNITLRPHDKRSQGFIEYKISRKRARNGGKKEIPDPTWKPNYNILLNYLPGRNKKNKPKRMMSKTYNNLCSNILEEKIKADAIDVRENNSKADFPYFIKELMVNQFGLVAIANETIASFVDCTLRMSITGHRAKLYGLLMGVANPPTYSPYCTEAVNLILEGIYDVNCIKEKLDDGDGNVWRSSVLVRKVLNTVISTAPLWQYSNLASACMELDVPCGFSAENRELLWSLIDKIELNLEGSNLNVVGEGTKVFDVDKLLYVLGYVWTLDYCRIVSDLERVRVLVEQEISSEEIRHQELLRQHQQRAFTEGEIAMVAEAVEVFGVGNYTLILEHYPFDGRTEEHIEAMWKIVLASKVEEEKEQWEWAKWKWDLDWEWDGLVMVEDDVIDDWPADATHGPKALTLEEMRSRTATQNSIISDPSVSPEAGDGPEVITLLSHSVSDMSVSDQEFKAPQVSNNNPTTANVVERPKSSGAARPKSSESRLPSLINIAKIVNNLSSTRNLTHAVLGPLNHPNRKVRQSTSAPTLHVKHLFPDRDSSEYAVGDLGHSKLGDKGAIAIARGLKDVLDPLSPTGGRRKGPLSPRGGFFSENSPPRGNVKPVGALMLGSNSIKSAGIIEICESLENSQVHTLDLSDNEIGLDGARAIAKLIASRSSTISKIDLSGTKLTDSTALPIFEALRSNKSVTELFLSRNNIKNCKLLAQVIEESKTLRIVDLSWNILSEKAGLEFANALTKAYSIQHLNLSFNSLGDRGAVAIAKAIPNVYSTFNYLNLSYNKITTIGGQALGENLLKNDSLTSLIISGNNIGRKGLRPFMIGIHSHDHHVELGLEDVGADLYDRKESLWNWIFTLVSDPAKTPSAEKAAKEMAKLLKAKKKKEEEEAKKKEAKKKKK